MPKEEPPQTIKIYISCGEWYPVYSFYKESDYLRHVAEVTEEEYKLLKDAFESFDKAQKLLSEKYSKSTHTVGIKDD